MKWAGRPRVALALTASITAFTAAACFGGPPPPPPPPGPCGTSSSGAQAASTGGTPAPLPPDSAAQKARDEATRSTSRTADNKIPLVTVALAPGGKPLINKTSVASADEAGRVAGQQAQGGNVVAVEVASPVHATLAGPDPLRIQQWALDQVPYEQAWATANTKGAGITVGVVDTGSTANHPDLAGQVLAGHSFLNNGTESNSAVDDNGHGTHVSGIIAAVNNNVTGISGAAPEVKIRPVKVLDSSGSGFNSDVASGITWEVDNGGAQVVNLSLGGPAFDQATCLAVRYAQQHDVVVVAAAGNCGGSSFQLNGCSSQDQPSYPGALSQSADGAEPIAVAATDEANPPNAKPAAHAPYSTTGSYVDISAPGGSSGSCTPASSCNILSTVPMSGPVSDPTGYKAIAGTSMATPYVSAAVALLRAAFPSCAASDVRARLLSTATDLGAPGPDATFGSGEVDPNTAVAACP
ncbi:MAG TPA: S8 family serine peptidase [Acidimicrobiia bacterium]|nr:S8 family serine peptidase [Acidimicrobiia bacterium]